MRKISSRGLNFFKRAQVLEPLLKMISEAKSAEALQALMRDEEGFAGVFKKVLSNEEKRNVNEALAKKFSELKGSPGASNAASATGAVAGPISPRTLSADKLKEYVDKLKEYIKNEPENFIKKFKEIERDNPELAEKLRELLKDSGETRSIEDYAEAAKAEREAAAARETGRGAVENTNEATGNEAGANVGEQSPENAGNKATEPQRESSPDAATPTTTGQTKGGPEADPDSLPAADPARVEEDLKKGDTEVLADRITTTDPSDLPKNTQEKLGEDVKKNPGLWEKTLQNMKTISQKARELNWSRAARIGAGIALGLGGIALFRYVWGLAGSSSSASSNGPIPPGGPPQSTTGSGYEAASLIMKAKGYLSSIQTSWTPEFDAAFRSYIDAGTATGGVKTNLVGGQSWATVAGPLGFAPNKTGAFDAIRSYSGMVPNKGSAAATSGGSAPPVPSAPAPSAPSPETEGASGMYPTLSLIIAAMYNEKLVGTPGFDLIREPKRIKAFVDAVGGANPAGYANAAKVLASRDPSLTSALPEKLTGPIDKAFAKNPANKALLQKVQVLINSIYDSAIKGVIKPGVEKSSEKISEWLSSPAGGNLKKANNNSADQWVKLASERKMRIRAEIAAEMTPAEMAAARRIKMREVV